MFQALPDCSNKRERKDLNHLLSVLNRKLRDKLPQAATIAQIVARDVPQPAKAMIKQPQPVNQSINNGNQSSPGTPPGNHQQIQEDTTPNSRKFFKPDESWRATFLLKHQVY